MSNKQDTKGMKPKAQHKFVPQLRFPEFRDVEEWEEKKLGEAATFYNGKAYKQEELLENGKYRVLRVGNFFTNDNWYYSDLELDNTKYCDNGDLLYAWSASFGPRIWQGEKVIYHYHIWKVEAKKNINKNFLFVVLAYETEKIKSQSANGLGLLHITKGTIENWKSYFPSIEEQQKIAECLASIDDRITLETQKLDALRAHKKGLMQQLFPAEGQTLPQLRFPEFRNEGEWYVKALQSFCKVGDIDHKMPSSVADGIPYIMTGDFCGINNINFDNAKKISTEDYEQLSKKIRPEFGDIVIARYASVGAVRYIETNIKFLVSYSCAIIKCDKSQNSKYLYYVFQSDIIQSKIRLEINMSSQKNIGIDSIKKLNIFLPTLPEQQKIADCLSSLDELIALQTQKIELLKQHKKGLMQQLFPAVDEVSG